jgi:hypothetical protein
MPLAMPSMKSALAIVIHVIYVSRDYRTSCAIIAHNITVRRANNALAN